MEKNELWNKYSKRNYEIVEGKVNVLWRQPYNGHAPGDLIQVGTKSFTINYFTMTHAYNQTISHGGCLRDGVNVRIFYSGNKILRIDVAVTGHENGSDQNLHI